MTDVKMELHSNNWNNLNVYKYNYLRETAILETNSLHERELLEFDRNTWNYLTGWKWMTSGLFKMLPTNNSFTNHISFMYV